VDPGAEAKPVNGGSNDVVRSGADSNKHLAFTKFNFIVVKRTDTGIEDTLNKSLHSH
jgi:hypothetical protein